MSPTPAPPPLPSSPNPPSSFLRQRLNLEYSTLVHNPPDSIYLSPTPPHSSSSSSSSQGAAAAAATATPLLITWSGIFLPRSGPYSPSALRFNIVFPPTYPLSPPRVLFATEVFHPLVVPLSTYRYSYTTAVPAVPSGGGSSGNHPGSEKKKKKKDGSGSSSNNKEDDGDVAEFEREETKQELEPGEINLQYGLKSWFELATRRRRRRRRRSGGSGGRAGKPGGRGGGGGRGGAAATGGGGNRQVSGESYKSSSTSGTTTESSDGVVISGSGELLGQKNHGSPSSSGDGPFARSYGVRDVLVYVTKAFTDIHDTMRHVPLEGAANPSAWLAWRSWRKTELGISDDDDHHHHHDKIQGTAGGGNKGPGTTVVVDHQQATISDPASSPVAGRTTTTTSSSTVTTTPLSEKRSSSSKRPEHWDWTNVFLERVRRHCEASLGDGALYGSAIMNSGDELIRFLDLGPDDLERMRRVVSVKGEEVAMRSL